ncbi:MAG TPA: CmcI family methyltransferase [Ensifer sp.]|nr:CmcI family methyltransferase [Ensifer sp.]
MKDDRQEFEDMRRAKSLALGEDGAAFDRAVEVLVDLDRYNYSYLWTWMGVPVIQLPADIMATQEVIWNSKPDVIVETGVARGGSVLMLASLLQLTGGRKVIGVDIDIRAHNRDSIERHPMSKHVELIEGSSTSAETLEKVRSHINPGDRVMVILDSDHSFEHVLNELRTYGPLVTEGCYLVVADTLLGFLSEDQTPRERSHVWLKGNEPLSAIRQYVTETDRFELDKVLNGKLVMSSSPAGYYRCIK